MDEQKTVFEDQPTFVWRTNAMWRPTVIPLVFYNQPILDIEANGERDWGLVLFSSLELMRAYSRQSFAVRFAFATEVVHQTVSNQYKYSRTWRSGQCNAHRELSILPVLLSASACLVLLCQASQLARLGPYSRLESFSLILTFFFFINPLIHY